MEGRTQNRLTRIDFNGLTNDPAAENGKGPASQPIEKSPSSSKSTTGRLQTRTVESRSGPLDLAVVEAVNANLRPHEFIRPKNSSPWNSYDKKYELKINEYVTVAVEKNPSCKLVAIKVFDREASREKLVTLQRLRHKRFASPLEIHNFRQTSFVVFDYIPLSLAQVVESPLYPNQEQLATILRQVILRS